MVINCELLDGYEMGKSKVFPSKIKIVMYVELQDY